MKNLKREKELSGEFCSLSHTKPKNAPDFTPRSSMKNLMDHKKVKASCPCV
jgi:hypothetical protein